MVSFILLTLEQWFHLFVLKGVKESRKFNKFCLVRHMNILVNRRLSVASHLLWVILYSFPIFPLPTRLRDSRQNCYKTGPSLSLLVFLWIYQSILGNLHGLGRTKFLFTFEYTSCATFHTYFPEDFDLRSWLVLAMYNKYLDWWLSRLLNSLT